MAQDPLNLYNTHCDYPPLYMIFLGVIGTLAKWLNLPLGTLDSPMGLVLLKLIPIACDLILGWFIYRVASKSWERARAPALRQCMCLIPPL